MPPSLRRRAQQHRLPPPEDSDDTDSEIDISVITGRGRRNEDEEGEEVMGGELVELEGDEELDEDEDALGKFELDLCHHSFLFVFLCLLISVLAHAI